MHITDQQAAERAADHENEYSRRRRNNRILNAVAISTVLCFVALYAIQHGGVQ